MTCLNYFEVLMASFPSVDLGNGDDTATSREDMVLVNMWARYDTRNTHWTINEVYLCVRQSTQCIKRYLVVQNAMDIIPIWCGPYLKFCERYFRAQFETEWNNGKWCYTKTCDIN